MRNEKDGVWYYDAEAVQPVDEIEWRRPPRWYAFGGPAGGFETLEAAREFMKQGGEHGTPIRNS